MKNKKGLFTYTTQIDPQKTVAQIQEELTNNGAKSILSNYDSEGRIESLSFIIKTPQGMLGFKLPCDVESVFRILKKQCEDKKIPKKFADKHQALRVAWRIILYWVKAQMALLETEMVKIEQIFLPYMIVGKNETLYERMKGSQFQLTEGQDQRKINEN